MSTSADKLTALHGIKADLFAATREKGLDTTGRTLENLHELWGGISSGGALQAKTAVPSNVDVEVTPDDGYAALSAVNIAAALNLKPWNIRKGKTLFGVTGTADIAVTTEVPSDIPVNKEDADTAYEEAVGSAPKDEDGNDLDMMTLADDNGNITYGYFLQGAANGSANGTCLYNGVELPDINTVWTDEVKETHPYAWIHLSGSVYYLELFKTQPSCWDSSGTGEYYFGYQSVQDDDYAVLEYYFDATALNDWSFRRNTTIENARIENVVWSNIDVVKPDGTVYLAASTSGFTITSYDPITTNFSAVGWRRLSYHTTGELAGQWTYDDFSTTASSGGNFLKNIIQCSREKLYYNGAEVWPNVSGTWSYNGVELPPLPVWDRSKWPYAVIVQHNSTKMYRLYYSANRPSVSGVYLGIAGECLYYAMSSGKTAWQAHDSTSDVSLSVGTSSLKYTVVWCNTDLLDASGDVYLAASTPIPVSE